MDEREERIQTAQAGFEEAWKKLKGIPDIKAIELSEALERVKRTHVGECATDLAMGYLDGVPHPEITPLLSGKRLYSPLGFTRQSEVVEALAGCMDEPQQWRDGKYGLLYFEGLPVEDARHLLALLPHEQAGDAQNASPPMEAMIEFGARWPNIRYFGYAVHPTRDDERITFTGFQIPYDGLTPQDLSDLQNLEADDFQDDDILTEAGAEIRAVSLWWD